MSEHPPPEPFWVPRPGSGRLALMAAPRPGAGLAVDVAALAAAGVSDVVCLLPDAELVRLGLADEPDLLARNGVRLHRLPVRDFGVPDESAARVLAAIVAGRLAEGAVVVVHCRGGVGRSSTVAATVLVHEGLAADDAWRVLAAARGRPVPETRAQRAFVAAFAGTPPPRRPLRRALDTAAEVAVTLVSGIASMAHRVRGGRSS
jgi:protein-tyrosine phosphatase